MLLHVFMKRFISICSLTLVIVSLAAGPRHFLSGSAHSQQEVRRIESQSKYGDSSLTREQRIRLVDFNQVAYPRYPQYTVRAKRYITLKGGEGGPAELNYGDVTGDSVEEAMMMLRIENRGSAIPEIVYIFGQRNGRLKLLWSFETGDRADGGLRQVYADGGNLIIELFGKDRIIGRNFYQGDEALCCPKLYTRARYEWRAGKFRLKEKPEVISNPAGDASSIMPPYFGPTKP